MIPGIAVGMISLDSYRDEIKKRVICNPHICSVWKVQIPQKFRNRGGKWRVKNGVVKRPASYLNKDSLHIGIFAYKYRNIYIYIYRTFVCDLMITLCAGSVW